jgi:hypothetical protein
MRVRVRKPDVDLMEIDHGSIRLLKPLTRLNPNEIAVDVKLQQDRGMIRGSAEFFDEDIDHASWIVLADPVFQAFRKLVV